MHLMDNKVWGSELISECDQKKILRYVDRFDWRFPQKPVFFLSDLHADPVAFVRSLVNAGLAKGNHNGFELTALGKSGRFVIGGDLLDKGPSNLKLLDLIKSLFSQGDVRLLIGNHDMRTYMGLKYVGSKNPEYSYLFSRLGRRAVPLIKEFVSRYQLKEATFSDDFIMEQLFVDKDWPQDFSLMSKDKLSPARLKKELRKAHKKKKELLGTLEQQGVSLQLAYSAIKRMQKEFFEGEFCWLWNYMSVAHREGSFLFVHAGIDDYAASIVNSQGYHEINRIFWSGIKREDAALTYNNPISNVFRTKYRDVDWPLTGSGSSMLHDCGIYALVHGHQTSFIGQRMKLRNKLLNIEADCAVDCNTRNAKELWTPGFAVTILEPSGIAIGYSADAGKKTFNFNAKQHCV